MNVSGRHEPARPRGGQEVPPRRRRRNPPLAQSAPACSAIYSHAQSAPSSPARLQEQYGVPYSSTAQHNTKPSPACSSGSAPTEPHPQYPPTYPPLLATPLVPWYACVQVYLTLAVALALSAAGVYLSALTGYGQGELAGVGVGGQQGREADTCMAARLRQALGHPPSKGVPTLMTSCKPACPASCSPTLFARGCRRCHWHSH